MDSLEIDAFIQQKFDSLLLKHFSQDFINMIGRKGSSGPKYFAHLSEKNKAFIASNYSYSGKNEFVHFTTLSALFSILNERNFRLYNLHNSNDPNEYKFIGNLLYGNNEAEFEFRKQYTYTFSCCAASEFENPFLWETYGNNYNGIAILFSIQNNPADWINFHMSAIKYSLNENIRNFSQEKIKIEREFNVVFDLDLSRLIGFHKDIDWAKENEIRILTYFPYQTFAEYERFSKTGHKINDQGLRYVEYIELPLWVDDSSPFIKDVDNPKVDKRLNLDKSFFLSHPQIKMLKILYGGKLGIHWKEICDLSEKLYEVIRYNFGYEIDYTSSIINKPEQ